MDLEGFGDLVGLDGATGSSNGIIGCQANVGIIWKGGTALLEAVSNKLATYASDRATERVATPRVGNYFILVTIFLGGESQCHRGRREDFTVKGCFIMELASSKEESDIL